MTQKIVASAVRIAAGQQDQLYLGNIEIQRDWGWAEDYVVAMYLMLQQEQFSFREATPTDDYVIATGESYKLAEFIEIAFRLVGLDWREYVVSDRGLCRPTDIAVSRGNPAKAILVPFVKRLPSQRGYANEKLGWVGKVSDC